MSAGLTPERIRMQQCRNADTCLCDHTGCHDGWIIQDVEDDGPASRCPPCFDAVLMHAERVAQREAEIRRARRYQP